MMELFKQQYNWVRGSRGVLLDFLTEHLPEQFKTSVPNCFDKSIGYLLVHNAYTYFSWLGNYAMQQNLAMPQVDDFNDLTSIRQLYAKVDVLMDEFLMRFLHQPDQLLNGSLPGGQQVQTTPAQLFTHVITHEFHHKGQILTMVRLLGCIPPDTDIIRF